MVVDDVLDKSGAKKWFSRCKVKIVRGVGESRVPMDVEYDNANDQVHSEYDYAIHPGDRVIVEEDPRTAFHDMLSALNPLE